MSPSDIGLLVAILALLVLSALFSATETAFTAANKVRLRTMDADGKKRAGKMLKYLEDVDRVVSAVLVGNNIVNITAASLSTLLFLSLFSGNASLATTLSTVILTVVVLWLCEITPKMIARTYPERTGMALLPFLGALRIIVFPLTWLFAQWKKLLGKIFRLKPESAITEDELLEYVETAANEGSIEAHESTLIKSAIDFEDIAVEDIMVPRVKVVAVSENTELKIIKERFDESDFSRLPVYSGTIDTIVGILHEKDFQKFLLTDKKPLGEILQRSICVPRKMKISVVLRILQKARVHMAIVVDEFGGTSGIVTLEDILEELVGEILDEHDEEEVLMRRTEDDTFMVSGMESLTTVLEQLGIEEDEEFSSTTIGGFATELFGKIPLAGETVTYNNLEITVTKSNAKRVLELKIKQLPPPDEEEKQKAASKGSR